MQLSIQTTESLQNKVGRKNTKQEQKRTNHTKQEKTHKHQKTKTRKNNKKTPQGVAEKMQILDHNLKAYKALIKSFKKANRACIVHPTGLTSSLPIIRTLLFS